MATRNENSVLFALNDLRAIELQRQADEAAEAEARKRREQAAREAQARELEERARIAAEEEVGTRRELGEAKLRIESLRGELHAMSCERERLVAEIATPPSETNRSPAERSSPLGWIATALASTVAAVLGFTLAVRPPEIRERWMKSPALVCPAAPVITAVPAPAIATPIVAAAPALVKPDRSRFTARAPQPNPKDHAHPTPVRSLSAMDDCGDDPICHLDVDGDTKHTPARPHR